MSCILGQSSQVCRNRWLCKLTTKKRRTLRNALMKAAEVADRTKFWWQLNAFKGRGGESFCSSLWTSNILEGTIGERYKIGESWFEAHLVIYFCKVTFYCDRTGSAGRCCAVMSLFTNHSRSSYTILFGEASGAFNEPPPSGAVAQPGTRAATCQQGWIKPIMYFPASCNLTLCCCEVEQACFLQEMMRNSLRTRSKIMMLTYLKQQSTTNRFWLPRKMPGLLMTCTKTHLVPCRWSSPAIQENCLFKGSQWEKCWLSFEKVVKDKELESLTERSEVAV